MNKYCQIIVVVTFVWIGFVCAISFMEAWLKFQALGINLPLGLGIGRLVFHALNKVEWFFSISIIVASLLDKDKSTIGLIAFSVAFSILCIQTFYLLPSLDLRAASIIAGEKSLPSNAHFIYIFIEALKVIALFTLGIKTLPKSSSTE